MKAYLSALLPIALVSCTTGIVKNDVHYNWFDYHPLDQENNPAFIQKMKDIEDKAVRMDVEVTGFSVKTRDVFTVKPNPDWKTTMAKLTSVTQWYKGKTNGSPRPPAPPLYVIQYQLKDAQGNTLLTSSSEDYPEEYFYSTSPQAPKASSMRSLYRDLGDLSPQINKNLQRIYKKVLGKLQAKYDD